MKSKVSQDYCTHDYWNDYPRKEMKKIDSILCLSEEDKQRIRRGESVSKLAGSYVEYFYPIVIG